MKVWSSNEGLRRSFEIVMMKVYHGSESINWMSFVVHIQFTVPSSPNSNLLAWRLCRTSCTNIIYWLERGMTTLSYTLLTLEQIQFYEDEHHDARQVFWYCQNTCTTAPSYSRYGNAIPRIKHLSLCNQKISRFATWFLQIEFVPNSISSFNRKGKMMDAEHRGEEGNKLYFG
jgi:hypothetical protein